MGDMIEHFSELRGFLDRHLDDVTEAVREAAAAEIVPRFRQLAEDDVVQKSGPHDLVTSADRLAELRLTDALTALLPGSAVVGEEAVHADPAVYGALEGDAPVWIVDPVDGTRQFVHGDPGFCTLVALVRGGETLASWTYAPALGELAIAVLGDGATLNGTRLAAGAPADGALLDIATSHPDFTTPAQKEALLGLRAPGVAPRPAARPGWSTWRWRAAPATRPPSPGRPPGTTLPGSCWSPRRAAPTSPATASPSATGEATPCPSRPPATWPRPSGW